MKIKSLLRLGRVRWNTKKNTSDAKSCYDGMMYHCRKLSAYDHSYAFVFHRNALGWPIINQIERPEQIDLSDNDDKVVIRDGFIYSIKKTNKTSKE